MKVAVFHPGTQHSYQTALAFQRAAVLSWYATQIYFEPTRPAYRALELLPAFAYKRVAREFERRFDPDLDPRLVRTEGSWEWLNAARSKLGLRGIGPWVLHRRNTGFARFVQKLTEREPVQLLWGYDNKSFRAFEGVERTGTLRILEQTVGHAATWNRILDEELDRVGRDIDTSVQRVPEHIVDELRSEHEHAEHVACGSAFVRDTLIDNGVAPDKLSVIPYGVDVDRFRPRRRPPAGPPFRLLFVGTFGLRKGAHVLLDAMRSLGPEFRLTVVGHRLLHDRCLEGAGDLVEFVPHVPRSRVHELYSRGDVFVLPSLFEGSSLVIYEALAAGLPVVTTPNAGSVITDGEEGFVVPIRDPEAVAERVRQLASQPDLLAAMGEKARATAERFTWTTYGGNVVDLARRLVVGP